MAHQFLGHAGRDAVAGEQRGERVPEAVDVYRAALGVAFGDPRRGKVQVERSQQVPPVDVEQRCVRRNRFAVGLGQTGDVLPQVVGQVASQGQRGRPPALGVLTFDMDVWVVLVEAQGARPCTKQDVSKTQTWMSLNAHT